MPKECRPVLNEKGNRGTMPVSSCRITAAQLLDPAFRFAIRNRHAIGRVGQLRGSWQMQERCLRDCCSGRQEGLIGCVHRCSLTFSQVLDAAAGEVLNCILSTVDALGKPFELNSPRN